jgi:hypothetical protein
VVDASVAAAELLQRGFVHLRAGPPDKRAAWVVAREVFGAAAQVEPIALDMPALEIVGEYTIPPVGALRRDFQTLHIDFGVPIQESEAVNVARFTALFVDSRKPATTALTRVVPLRALLGQRQWPGRHVLAARVRSYGDIGHDRSTYVEGILARLVEAADGCSALPSTADPGFLCGMEFGSVEDEQVHFARHGLRLDSVERRIALAPGEVLLFDNLAIAHGRAGKRRPEELHQLCVGYRALNAIGQRAVLNAVLNAFGTADE